MSETKAKYGETNFIEPEKSRFGGQRLETDFPTPEFIADETATEIAQDAYERGKAAGRAELLAEQKAERKAMDETAKRTVRKMWEEAGLRPPAYAE